MENDEQQGPRSHVDTAIVVQVLASAKDVNDNLAAVLKHTDKVVVRQNILICLAMTAIFLMVIQVLTGRDIQKRQLDAKHQLAQVEMTRVVLQGELDELAKIVRGVKHDLQESITSAPKVTADSSGQINLEVNREQPVQTATPERVVIPLKPSQVRAGK